MTINNNLFDSNPELIARIMIDPVLRRAIVYRSHIWFFGIYFYEYIKDGETFPIFMEVNLTDRCNLKCKWCIADNRFSRNSSSLQLEPFKTFVEDFYGYGGKALTWCGRRM